MSNSRSLKRPSDYGDGNNDVKYPRLCDDSRHVMLKMLCPNDFAGSVIGRGGSNLASLRSSGGTIHISKNGESFPDLLDRIIVMTGSMSSVISMTDSIIRLLFEHRLNSGSRNVSFPLPQSASGVIIGKSGKKLQNMREKYGCKILLRRIEAVSDERVLTITADNAATVIECITEVIDLINRGDGLFGVYQNKSCIYHPTFVPPPPASLGCTTLQTLPGMFPPPLPAANPLSHVLCPARTGVPAMSIQINLPAELVPSIMADKGVTLNEITAQSNAVIQVSGDPNAGHVFTVIGTPIEVQIAQAKIMSKITGQ